MKNKLVGIQSSVSTTYVPNSTTTTSTLGKARQRTISGDQVIGPALNKFIDVITDTGLAPSYIYFIPSQNKLFILQSSTAAAASVILYDFDTITGAFSYTGRVTLNFANSAATTNTQRGFSVWTDGTNVRIVINNTGSVAINSGNYIAYCPLSFFTSGGTNLFAASDSGQNAIYLAQNSLAYGVRASTANGLNNVAWGCDIAQFSTDPAINTKLYSVLNTIASPVASCYDLAITPDVAGKVISGVSSSTTIITNTSPSAYFSMSSNPGYSGTNGEPVCLQSGTTAVPTPLTAWASGTLQTTSNVYFVRDLQRLCTFNCNALTTGISAGSTYTQTIGTTTLTITVVTLASAGATSFVGSIAMPAISNAPSSPITTTPITRATGTGDATITLTSLSLGNFCFNLSATSGTVALVPTQSSATFSMVRAFGTSTNMHVGNTALLPAIAGTVLQTNSVNYAKPINAPLNPSLNGQDCLSIATTSNVYLGRLSELFVSKNTCGLTYGSAVISISDTSGLTNGMTVFGSGITEGATITSITANTSITISLVASQTVTTSLTFGVNNWLSLTGANLLGTTLDVVATTATFARYSGIGSSYCIDNFLVSIATSLSIMLKPLQNNNILASFGGTDNQYYELSNITSVYGGFLQSILGIESKAGWLFLSGGSTGQRGVVVSDISSDGIFGNTALITPVKTEKAGSLLNSVNVMRILTSVTGRLNFWIRSSTANNTTFASANIPTPSNNNGWTRIYPFETINSTVIGPYYQFCLTYQILTPETQSPSQVVDIEYSYTPPGEISDKWQGSVDNTSIDGASPSYTAFRMMESDSGTKYFKAFDDAGNLIVSANTSADYLLFDKSTNNGATWSPMSGPNDYSSTPFTTEIRYKWSTPPGVNVTVSLGDR